MRGASIRRHPVPGDPVDGMPPQPPGYLPLLPSGHAVLAGDIAEAADPARQVPAERLRGLCEAYTAVAGLSVMIRDEHDVADVAARAREDYERWQAASLALGQPDLTYYLRLTQEQEDAEERMEKLTRDRGSALAEYQRQAGASLQGIAEAIRGHGYVISRAGVAWLIRNAAPR